MSLPPNLAPDGVSAGIGLPTREDGGWGRRFAAPRKKICGPGQDAGSARAAFLAPTRNLAVILRVGRDAGSAKVALRQSDTFVAEVRTPTYVLQVCLRFVGTRLPGPFCERLIHCVGGFKVSESCSLDV